jgi:hypothetical protein
MSRFWPRLNSQPQIEQVAGAATGAATAATGTGAAAAAAGAATGTGAGAGAGAASARTGNEPGNIAAIAFSNATFRTLE